MEKGWNSKAIRKGKKESLEKCDTKTKKFWKMAQKKSQFPLTLILGQN